MTSVFVDTSRELITLDSQKLSNIEVARRSCDARVTDSIPSLVVLGSLTPHEHRHPSQTLDRTLCPEVLFLKRWTRGRGLVYQYPPKSGVTENIGRIIENPAGRVGEAVEKFREGQVSKMRLVGWLVGCGAQQRTAQCALGLLLPRPVWLDVRY